MKTVSTQRSGMPASICSPWGQRKVDANNKPPCQPVQLTWHVSDSVETLLQVKVESRRIKVPAILLDLHICTYRYTYLHTHVYTQDNTDTMRARILLKIVFLFVGLKYNYIKVRG